MADQDVRGALHKIVLYLASVKDIQASYLLMSPSACDYIYKPRTHSSHGLAEPPGRTPGMGLYFVSLSPTSTRAGRSYIALDTASSIRY